jgi:hypothetical protein
MGIIIIELAGSFWKTPIGRFSALHGGHAKAVAESIEWLSATVLPLAIQQDHVLHSRHERPDVGFGKPKGNTVETEKST